MGTTKEIDLNELFKFCFKKWWLILLLSVIGFGSAYYYTANFMTPVYEAKTVLYIGREASNLGSIDVSLGQLEADSQLIVDYKQIALTRLVIDAVVKNTGLKISENEALNGGLSIGSSGDDPMSLSYKEFRDNTIIETVENSRLFTVGFTYSDPVIAKKVSDELAKQLTIAVSQIVGVENIRILDQSLVPLIPVAPSKLKNSIMGGLFGLVAALIIIFMIYITTDTVDSEEDVRNLIGVSVLGSIPEFKGEAR